MHIIIKINKRGGLIFIEITKKLDQYYTKETVSLECLKILKNLLEKHIDFKNQYILEPSAGTGSFIKSYKELFNIPNNFIYAYDIDPKYENIKKCDFLPLDIDNKNFLTIGNPPFGSRSKLAITFFNKCAEISHTIAFIVPLQFQKWSVQKQLNKELKLIYSENLKPDSFYFENKTFKVGCCFQIWTKLEVPINDMRIKEPPKTKHSDFEMYQYNNTEEAKKYFDYDWDFCVPRQGFYDYKTLITKKEDCKSNVQYIFFKAKNKKILEKLKKLDFETLSKKNTIIPGFGKADVVEEYEEGGNS